MITIDWTTILPLSFWISKSSQILRTHDTEEQKEYHSGVYFVIKLIYLMLYKGKWNWNYSNEIGLNFTVSQFQENIYLGLVIV